MPTDNKAAVIEKVKKLLALANDAGASPNEAASAARQAQALMRKWQLEDSDVIFKELKNKANVKMVWVRATTRKNAPRKNDDTPLWAQVFAASVATYFDCDANMRKVQLKQGWCSVLCFYGYDADVQVCAWTYEYLLDCVRRLAREYEEMADALEAAGKAKSNREALDSFRFGAATEINRKLAQLIYEKRRAEQGNPVGTALVVSKRTAIEEAFGKIDYGEGEPEAKTKNAVAMMHGRIKGSTVNVMPGKPLENKS